jgi:DNA-binding winged helix-turn-helix (wHTH) protein
VRATTFTFESCELDVARYTLSRDGEAVHVAPRVFDLLQHLLRNRARVVPKDELLDALWGSRFVSETALTTALRSVRAAIGDSGEEQRLIRTVHGRGYQFVGVVDARDDAGRVPGAGADPERQSIRFCTADDGTRIAWATTGSGPVLLKAANWLSHLDLEWRSRLCVPRHRRDRHQAGETDSRAEVGTHREQLHLSDDDHGHGQ